MQYAQTRYEDTISPGINSTALAVTVAGTAPTRTQGVVTIGRSQGNTEDCYYTGVAGTILTIGVRGLSTTALTPTEVAGNKKVHNPGESIEITTHHLYDANKARKDENETISVAWTFSGNNIHNGNETFNGNDIFANSPRMPGIKDSNNVLILDLNPTVSAVNYLRVKNSIAASPVLLLPQGSDTDISVEIQGKGTGVVVVPDKSTTKTNAAPTADTQIANKKYVDDTVALGVATAAVSEHLVYTPAFLTGGAAPTSNYLLWLGTNNGSFRFTLNGVLRDITGIDFTTGVTSMTDVASKIQAAIRGVTGSTETCTWNGSRFIITSALTTSSSAITVLSSAGVGTDISGAGATQFMDSDTGNGVVTNAVVNPAADAGKLVKLYTDGDIRDELLTSNVQLKTDLTAKGDLYAATASGAVTRLPVSTNGKFLTADSSQATGLKWGYTDNLTVFVPAGEAIFESATQETQHTGSGNVGGVLVLSSSATNSVAFPVQVPRGATSISSISLMTFDGSGNMRLITQFAYQTTKAGVMSQDVDGADRTVAVGAANVVTITALNSDVYNGISLSEDALLTISLARDGAAGADTAGAVSVIGMLFIFA